MTARARPVSQLSLPYLQPSAVPAGSGSGAAATKRSGKQKRSRSARLGNGTGNGVKFLASSSASASAPASTASTASSDALDSPDSMTMIELQGAELLLQEGGAIVELRELWQSLADAETELIQKQNQGNLTEYKNLIRKICLLTIKKNTKVRNLSRKNAAGQKQKYQLIKVINGKLNALTLLLFGKENKAFQLYRTFAEIRGLILDISQ